MPPSFFQDEIDRFPTKKSKLQITANVFFPADVFVFRQGSLSGFQFLDPFGDGSAGELFHVVFQSLLKLRASDTACHSRNCRISPQKRAVLSVLVVCQMTNSAHEDVDAALAE